MHQSKWFSFFQFTKLLSLWDITLDNKLDQLCVFEKSHEPWPIAGNSQRMCLFINLVRGRSLDIPGAGAWSFFEKNCLSLNFQEKKCLLATAPEKKKFVDEKKHFFFVFMICLSYIAKKNVCFWNSFKKMFNARYKNQGPPASPEYLMTGP